MARNDDSQASGSADLLPVHSSTDLVALSTLESILIKGEVPDGTFQTVDDPAEAERQIIAQLLAAESDEELERGDAIPWQDIAGIPVRISGFKWMQSTFKSDNPNYVNNPVYFVVFGERLDEGSQVVLTCGSKGVCAALVNLAKRGRIPGAIRTVERTARETRRGFQPMRLVTPEGYAPSDANTENADSAA